MHLFSSTGGILSYWLSMMAIGHCVRTP